MSRSAGDISSHVGYLDAVIIDIGIRDRGDCEGGTRGTAHIAAVAEGIGTLIPLVGEGRWTCGGNGEGGRGSSVVRPAHRLEGNHRQPDRLHGEAVGHTVSMNIRGNHNHRVGPDRELAPGDGGGDDGGNAAVVCGTVEERNCGISLTDIHRLDYVCRDRQLRLLGINHRHGECLLGVVAKGVGDAVGHCCEADRECRS